MRKNTSLFLLLFLVSSGSFARQEQVICGTTHERWKEEVYLHRQSQRLRKAAGLERSQASILDAAARDIGNIAVIEDSDGVVARRNDFNLDRKTVRFLPSAPQAARYRFEVADGDYSTTTATAGTRLAGLADDDTRQVDLPFAFPFFGTSYRKVFVNSDGNLTFVISDTGTGDRSLGRVTAGPPRIAGLFRDLDPSVSATGVRVLAEPTQFVVSWLDVPEYSDFGSGPIQRFQIRLFPDGRVEFAYSGITTQSAIVGIAPGGLLGASAVVSFLTTPSSQEFTSAIAERFTRDQEVDIVLAAQKFYETHEDAYDYLVLFNNLDVAAGGTALAFEVTVRSDRTGIGDEQVDVGRLFGSGRRLQAMMNMGPLTQYPTAPDAAVPGRGGTGDTTLTVLAHEAGHLFLAFASVRDPGNPSARPMLGRSLAHWSFLFNSEASVLEGNRIRDDGPNANSRFTTVATVEAYSPLDQYLMGFRPPQEVPPSFLVTNTTSVSAIRAPRVGVSFNGDRRDVTIEEIIAAEGRRTPDHTVAQRRFRFAFVLIVAQASQPSAEDIAKLETFRTAFESFYRQASGDRASADTSFRRALQLSTSPAAGVLAGATMTTSVAIDRPAETPLTVLLSTQTGAIRPPQSVMIPAGAVSVPFTISGERTGVDELTAEIPGDAYERAVSRIQVLALPSALKLEVISGDKQVGAAGVQLPEAIVARVSDINNLSYPGLRVVATATAGGTVQPAAAVSDENGTVRFQWTPGPNVFNELRLSLEGGPTAAATTVGRPSFTAAGVVNAASFASGISPGSLASMFGVSLAAGRTAAATTPVTDRLAGVQVSLNQRTVPLLFVSDGQINFMVPSDLSPGTVDIAVSTPLGSSGTVQVPLTAFSPGIFFLPDVGAVLVSGTGQATNVRPAAPGEFLEIFSTGLGATQSSTRFPGLWETIAAPQVSVAALPASVSFSGLAPGFIGLYQVNAQVPSGTPSGFQPLTLEIGGVRGNQVLVQIQ